MAQPQGNNAAAGPPGETSPPAAAQPAGPSPSGRFLRNVTSLTSANLAAAAVQAVIGILIVNYFGDARYGAFNKAMAFSTVFLIFAETGVGARFLYDRSGDKSRISEHFGAAILLQLGPYLLTFALTIAMARVLAPTLKYDATVVTLIVIVSAAAVFRVFAEVCEKVLNVYQEIHITAVLRAVRFVSIAGGGIAVMLFHWGLIAWGLVTLVVMFVAAVLTLGVSLRLTRPRFVLSTLWPTLRSSYIFGLGAVFLAIYEYVDRPILSALLPGDRNALIGRYAAAYTLVMFTTMLAASVVASLEPIVYGAKEDKARLAHIGSLAVRSLAVIGLPLAAATALLSRDVKALVLPRYDPMTATVLALLAPFLLFKFANFPGGMLMAASGQQRRRAFLQGIAVALNIGVNLALIPILGIFGAAVTTMITEGFLLVMYQTLIRRALPGYGEYRRFAKPLAATAIMAVFIVAARAAVVATLGGGRFAWLLVVPPAVAVYFGALHWMRFFTDEERGFLARIFARFGLRRSAL